MPTNSEWTREASCRGADTDQWYLVGRKPADHDTSGFQGIHDDFLLLIIDEAGGVPVSIWMGVDTVSTVKAARVLAIGNPDEGAPNMFERICRGAPDDVPGMSDEGWWVIPIPAAKTPLFTGEEIPEAMETRLVTPEWVERFGRTWGIDSPAYESKVLARFPRLQTTGVVPYGRLLDCQREEAQARAAKSRLVPVELGVDVAASEAGKGDQTVIFERLGMVAGRKWTIRSSDPDKVIDLISEAIGQAKPSRVKLDAIGIGWGLLPMLRQRHPRIEFVPVNVSEQAADPTRYVNLRSEIWWEVGRTLTMEGLWDLSSVDEETLAELAAPRYKHMPGGGRIRIEAKEETRKPDRLGRSPDSADALLLCFFVPSRKHEASIGSYTTGR